jgi:small multidrug resistance pump
LPSALSYLYLGVAIVAEVTGTTSLKASETFTKLWPSVVTLAAYAVSFVFLSLALRTIPTGIAYAIWSGVGIVLITTVSWIWFDQVLDTPALVGLGLIILGVAVVNLFSRSIGA